MSSRITRRLTYLAVGGALMALSVPALATASGSDDDGGRDRDRDRGEVIKRGSCSGPSNWKLKAKPDDGRLEVEFEVDQNRSGVRWRVGLRRDGNRVGRVSRRTKAPSGSFSFEREIANPPGKSRIVAVARRAGGETCTAALRI